MRSATLNCDKTGDQPSVGRRADSSSAVAAGSGDLENRGSLIDLWVVRPAAPALHHEARQQSGRGHFAPSGCSVVPTDNSLAQ